MKMKVLLNLCLLFLIMLASLVITSLYISVLQQLVSRKKESPGDRARKQINYIMMNQRFRNAVKDARAFPGANCKSDHNPVVVRFKLSLKQVPKPVRRKRGFY